VTRISIRAQDNPFDKNLASMIARAAPYFGQESNGLLERYEGTVKLADPQFLGIVPAENPATPQPAPATQPGSPTVKSQP
jgi:hypothetical protein